MDLLFSLFLMLSVMGCIFSYISLDPMKSCFFLIFSMLMIMPVVSFLGVIWFSYFISLLFLSGIFVILVYFSSLSKFGGVKASMMFLGLVMTVIFGLLFDFGVVKMMVGLNVFYYSIYWCMLLYVLFVLLVFMNFTSYFLSFSGALRKV